MFHKASTEWPCLSVDFLASLQDPFDLSLKNYNNPVSFKYPIEVFLVGGSQAEKKNQNTFYLMKFQDLSVTKYDDNDDPDESFEDKLPEMVYCKFPINSATNRVKSMNNLPIVGIMNDNSQV